MFTLLKKPRVSTNPSANFNAYLKPFSFIIGIKLTLYRSLKPIERVDLERQVWLMSFLQENRGQSYLMILIASTSWATIFISKFCAPVALSGLRWNQCDILNAFRSVESVLKFHFLSFFQNFLFLSKSLFWFLLSFICQFAFELPDKGQA